MSKGLFDMTGGRKLSSYGGFGLGRSKPKRKSVSAHVKILLWERSKGHKCHICGGKIHSITEAEADHVRAAAKGGTTVKWAHRYCNRLKGKKSLSQVRRQLGLKTKKRKTTRRKKRSSSGGLFGSTSRSLWRF